MQLRTSGGVIEIQVLHGQDPGDEHWGSPVREHWGLTSHQQLSLALEDKLAFTLTATGSFEEAAAVARKWGSPVSAAVSWVTSQRDQSAWCAHCEKRWKWSTGEPAFPRSQ